MYLIAVFSSIKLAHYWNITSSTRYRMPGGQRFALVALLSVVWITITVLFTIYGGVQKEKGSFLYTPLGLFDQGCNYRDLRWSFGYTLLTVATIYSCHMLFLIILNLLHKLEGFFLAPQRRPAIRVRLPHSIPKPSFPQFRFRLTIMVVYLATCDMSFKIAAQEEWQYRFIHSSGLCFLITHTSMLFPIFALPVFIGRLCWFNSDPVMLDEPSEWSIDLASAKKAVYAVSAILISSVSTRYPSPISLLLPNSPLVYCSIKGTCHFIRYPSWFYLTLSLPVILFQILRRIISSLGPEPMIQEELPELSKLCLSCDEEKGLFNFLAQLEGHYHEINTCHDCFQGWLTSEMNMKLWFRIGCPECDILLRYSDVRAAAETVLFERYDRSTLRSTTDQDPEFCYCRSATCESGQIHPDNPDQPLFICHACGHRHCVPCDVLWHEGVFCEDFQAAIRGREEAEQRQVDQQRTA